MSLPREDRLKALGLWPVWRLRAAEHAPSPTTPNGTDMTDAQDSCLKNHGAPMDPWTVLRAEVQSCQGCELHATRSQAVFGVGDTAADWLIVGEAPGADEDRLGEPFVGQAGKLLDAMLAAIGLRRGEDVYIANVLKSRPPGNRDPKPEEVQACLPFLLRQIDLIQPKLILAMGRFAAQSLLVTDNSIARMRGSVHEYHGVPMIVTYHPAYLLRNPADKAKSWEDLCLARQTMARLKGPGKP